MKKTGTLRLRHSNYGALQKTWKKCKVQAICHHGETNFQQICTTMFFMHSNDFPLYLGIIVALKRKRAAISAECSDVLSKLKDVKKTTWEY